MSKINYIDDTPKLINEKIGNNTQIWTGATKTVLAYSNSAYKHIHNPGLCYPDDGTVIQVTTSATEKTYGDYVDVIPINTFNFSFDIHWVSIANISAVGDYILDFHTLDGDGVSLGVIGQADCHRTDNFTRVGPHYLQIPVQLANARIGVRARKGTDVAGTVSFVVQYHDYL